jgi:hypothetical protein
MTAPALSSLPCLLDVFSMLSSPRRTRGTRYPLASTLALVLIAILSGCKNHSQIYAFGLTRGPFLKRLGFHPPKYPRHRENRGRIGCPNEDTLAAILDGVDGAEFNEKFALFLSRMVARGAKAAIDSAMFQALRGAEEYVLSVFVNDVCQVAWQETIGSKESELSSLSRSLSAILSRYPQIKLFTGDAAFCHKTIARQFIRAKRDYFPQLKAPHTVDLALAEDAFEQLRQAGAPAAETVERRGGRRGRK